MTNKGAIPTRSLFFAIDYVTLPSLPTDVGRFHAQYRQSAPCKGVSSDGKNLGGKDNYVFPEAAGKGHFVGMTNGVMQNENGWFGEGDDMFFIDDDTVPTINGTGAEDYFNGAWGFGGQPYSHPHVGAPYIVDPERIGGRYCLYRWHPKALSHLKSASAQQSSIAPPTTAPTTFTLRHTGTRRSHTRCSQRCPSLGAHSKGV